MFRTRKLSVGIVILIMISSAVVANECNLNMEAMQIVTSIRANINKTVATLSAEVSGVVNKLTDLSKSIRNIQIQGTRMISSVMVIHSFQSDSLVVNNSFNTIETSLNAFNQFDMEKLKATAYDLNAKLTKLSDNSIQNMIHSKSNDNECHSIDANTFDKMLADLKLVLQTVENANSYNTFQRIANNFARVFKAHDNEFQIFGCNFPSDDIDVIMKRIMLLTKDLSDYVATKGPECGIAKKRQSQIKTINKCSDLRPDVDTSGVYNLEQLDGMDNYFGGKVFCKFLKNDSTAWTVIQRRSQSKYKFLLEFAQKMPAYEKGFGNLRRDFWIGNEVVHRLSQDRLELKIVIRGDKQKDTQIYDYDHFKIDNKDNNYRLHITSSSVNPLSQHDGLDFSVNCLNSDRGGWWFKTITLPSGKRICMPNNLNGVTILWSQNHPKIAETTMMVRVK